ncbi:MAG: GyrI-like domain-containing protein, partial [Humidesulfovibrio sp.]|nr:GyrI-like domain-containing protein [Humidesulfovibrio sp.]
LAHFSVSHFHRVFKGMLGETIMDHLRRIRLERAHAQLTQSHRSVTDIGLDAGYDSLEAFSRVFRKTFDLSPSQCRERRRNHPFPLAPSGVHYGAGEIVEILFDTTGEAMLNVRINALPEQRIIKVRELGPYKESAERAWKILCGWAAPRGLFVQNTLFIGIGHDDPSVTKPEAIRYDAAITVEGPAQAEPPVASETLPGGEYAIITHKGPYEKLEDTYKTIMGQWLPQSGREFRGTQTFEVYRNNPTTTPPDELLTDIHIPLK